MINPQEMRDQDLQQIINDGTASAEDKAAAAFESRVRDILYSKVFDGLAHIKVLVSTAKAETLTEATVERAALIIEEAFKRESRRGYEVRSVLLSEINKARNELADMIYTEDEKQAANYSEQEFYDLIDDALDTNPNLAIEVGYNSVTTWVVSIYDARGVGLAKAPQIASAENHCRRLAMFQAAKQLKKVMS